MVATLLGRGTRVGALAYRSLLGHGNRSAFLVQHRALKVRPGHIAEHALLATCHMIVAVGQLSTRAGCLCQLGAIVHTIAVGSESTITH